MKIAGLTPDGVLLHRLWLVNNNVLSLCDSHIPTAEGTVGKAGFEPASLKRTITPCFCSATLYTECPSHWATSPCCRHRLHRWMAALLFPLFQWLPTVGWPSRIRTDISTRHSVALLPWGSCALILSANAVFPSVRCLSISHPSAQCTFGIIILRLPCSGGRIRTADLRVMGPASWPLLYPAVLPILEPHQ